MVWLVLLNVTEHLKQLASHLKVVFGSKADVISPISHLVLHKLYFPQKLKVFLVDTRERERERESQRCVDSYYI